MGARLPIAVAELFTAIVRTRSWTPVPCLRAGRVLRCSVALCVEPTHPLVQDDDGLTRDADAATALRRYLPSLQRRLRSERIAAACEIHVPAVSRPGASGAWEWLAVPVLGPARGSRSRVWPPPRS
jgi:hypothetical protein